MNKQLKDEILAALEEIKRREEKIHIHGSRNHEQIQVLAENTIQKVLNEDDESVSLPSDEILEEPPWVTEFSNLRSEELSNLSPDEEAAEFGPEALFI